MQTASFAGMFNQNADQWARKEPMILSDFTARTARTGRELAPLAGKRACWIWGAEKDTLPVWWRRQVLRRYFGIDISGEMVGGPHNGCRERCTVPDDVPHERQRREFSGISAGAIRPGDRRVYGQLFELC